MGAKWGDKKIRPFLKNGDAQNKKYGQTAGKSEKYRIFLFQKKKDGEKMGTR